MLNQKLVPGLEYDFSYNVPENKTVSFLYPEAPEFQTMPKVFATGFAVGLVEWACMRLINVHAESKTHITLGAHIDIWHCAPAVQFSRINAWCRLLKVDGNGLLFKVRAHHLDRLIVEGTHLRTWVNREAFECELKRLRENISLAPQIA